MKYWTMVIQNQYSPGGQVDPVWTWVRLDDCRVGVTKTRDWPLLVGTESRTGSVGTLRGGWLPGDRVQLPNCEPVKGMAGGLGLWHLF